MASFFKNICRFDQCGLEYASLYDLIQHIEECHIVNDAECQKRFESLQQHGHQPAPLVSLSFICRYYQKLPDRKPKPLMPEPASQTPSSVVSLPKKRPSVAAGFSGHLPGPPVVSVNFQTPAAPSVSGSSISSSNVGNDADEDSLSVDNESLSSDSTVVDDAAADPNYTITAANRFLAPTSVVEERRYACPVPGCKKKYKNINGVRYHSKIAHQGPDQAQNVKAFKCGSCNKAYKTNNGLHNHQVQTGHKSVASMTPVAPPAQIPSIKQQQQTTFPVTLIASNASHKGSAAGGPAAIRVSPAQSPTVSSLTSGQQQNPGLKLTSSLPSGHLAGVASTIPSGVSIQVQPTTGAGVQHMSGAGVTTVHVPQQGAAGSGTTGSSSVLNVSVLGTSKSFTAAGVKRSASTANLVGSGRPLKIPATAPAGSSQRNQLVHNLIANHPNQVGSQDFSEATVMGPPTTTINQYLKQ